MHLRRTLQSNAFLNAPLSNQRFQATFIQERSLYANPEPLYEFLESASQSRTLGIAGAYVPATPESQRDCTACLLTKLAVATSEQVLVITLHFPSEDPADIVDHTLLHDNLFSPTNPRLYVGFSVDRLALQLFGEYGLLIQNGIDALAMGTDSDSIDQARTPRAFAKTQKTVFLTSSLLNLLRDEGDLDSETDSILATRAWIGAVLEQASEAVQTELFSVPPINLSLLKTEELLELKKTLQSSDRLRGSASDFQEHNIDIEYKQGKFIAVSNQFNSRVRRTELELEIVFENVEVTATVVKAKGKRAELKLTESIDLKEAGALISARTQGKEEATNLDHQRSNLILFALQGRASILKNPLLKQIWFPDQCEPRNISLPAPELYGEEWKKLNRSQLKAVRDMLKESPDPRIVLVHGPPGTGKTSVIAAMTQSLLLSGGTKPNDDEEIHPVPDRDGSDSESDSTEDGPTVWIIAQSNVAVKNVAEKLVKIGIEEFKLIVSSDFHIDWHEHLYHKIKANMCNTGDLPLSKGEVSAFLRTTRVILCTLSMITSPRLRQLEFHKVIPVKNVVVDEASQIQLGDLLPLLHIFGTEIERICLVGDHKQLAPYGQEEVEEIESIFEKKHIVKGATLLNVTYRLPKPISNIISSKVYDSKLLPNSTEERPTCCKWIDIPGEEKQEDSGSYVNENEVEACLLLAKELEAKNKDYRIISPYASQTDLILKRLKEEDMQWQDKCFNVDSFQGNEADYIVISLVRTNSIGFLDNNRRANVLLTRCRKGMFVLCSKALMTGNVAQKTLLGQFASRWHAEQERSAWPNHQDLIDGVPMVDEDLVTEPPLVSKPTPLASPSVAKSSAHKTEGKKSKSKAEAAPQPSSEAKESRRRPQNKGKGRKKK